MTNAAEQRGTGLLTADEHRAVELAGELANLLARIMHDGDTRYQDTSELVGNIHAIQHAVMAQAAARAYPDRYRLLGSVVTQKNSTQAAPVTARDAGGSPKGARRSSPAAIGPVGGTGDSGNPSREGGADMNVPEPRPSRKHESGSSPT